MIISVHVPKAAGTTLIHYLKTQFNVYEDYEFRATLPDLFIRHPDNPGDVQKGWMYTNPLNAILKTPGLVKKMKAYDCIHGHFHVMKYKFYPNAKFVAFVREPLERMVSHYYFWKKLYETGNPGKNLYVDYLFKKNTSLNEFLFDENIKNQQCKFIRGINLSRYSFIGVADEEYFADDMNYLFYEILKRPLKNSVVEKLNKTDYNRYIPNIDIDAFRKFHKIDYEIYEYAMQKRKIRLAAAQNYKAA